MKARFVAGTDVAMIGAWDAGRGTEPFSAAEFKRLSETLDADAAEGHLFVLHTGADGGGPVDVYVDEPIPDDAMARLTPLGDELILALPTGRLMVDGAEYYRARKPDPARADRAVAVPPGDYVLRCYVAKDHEEESKPQSERELEAVVGRADLQYYERVTRAGCFTGLALLLLFPLLLPLVGSRIAVVATLIVVVAYFSIRERRLRRRERFRRLRETITEIRLGGGEADFVLELRPVKDRAGHTGGSVSLV